MTLLEEFIYSLSKTERSKLRPLQFRGAKKKVFTRILNCREPEGIDREQLTRLLKTTDKRFYQMMTEMLHACYHDVAPAGGPELLQYLGNMQLYRHFYQEMQRQEKLLVIKNDRKKLEEFYFKVLLMSEFFLIPPHLGVNIRAELTKYIHRYTNIKDLHPCDQRFIRCAEIEEEINQNFMRDFSLEKLRASTDEMEEIYACVKDKDHALAKFKVTYWLAMIYFGNYFKDKRPEPYIAEIHKILKEHADVFGSVTELMTLGIQSYSVLNDTDIESYKKFLESPTQTGEASSLVFIERFLPLVVKAGEIEWAKKFIANHFPLSIGQLRKDIALHWWRLLVVYNSYSGEYKEGDICLQKAFSCNTGKLRNTDMEINLRCFDVFLRIMQEGSDLAGDHIMRHIRYARRHGYNKGESFMMLFLRAVYDLVSHPTFDKAHAKKVREEYHKALDKEERQYPLFEKIYQKYYT